MDGTLHCINSLDNGGVEGIKMDVYRNIDREQIQFDFLLRNTTELIIGMKLKVLEEESILLLHILQKVFKDYSVTKRIINEHLVEYDTIRVHESPSRLPTILILS